MLSPPSPSLSNLRSTSRRTTLLSTLPRASHPTRQIKITRSSHASTRSTSPTRRCLDGAVHASERAVFLLVLEFGFEFWIDWFARKNNEVSRSAILLLGKDNRIGWTMGPRLGGGMHKWTYCYPSDTASQT